MCIKSHLLVFFQISRPYQSSSEGDRHLIALFNKIFISRALPFFCKGARTVLTRNNIGVTVS